MNAPRNQLDGLPAQIFFQRKNESMLSDKLMLWGYFQGIVSFEGMLAQDVLETNSNPDVEFLRIYDGYPEPGVLWAGMRKGYNS